MLLQFEGIDNLFTNNLSTLSRLHCLHSTFFYIYTYSKMYKMYRIPWYLSNIEYRDFFCVLLDSQTHLFIDPKN